ENRRRPGHTLTGKERGENAVARRGSKGYAFPMREFTGARLTHGRASHAGNVHCVPSVWRIKFHQLRGRERSRERSVSHVIPAAGTNTGRIGQPALHLVCERDGRNHFASTSPHAFPDGEHG